MHVAIPEIEWRGVRYSVPVRCLRTEGRSAQRGRLYYDRNPLGRRVVAAHTVGDSGQVWDPDTTKKPKQLLSVAPQKSSGTCAPETPPRNVSVRLEIEGDVDVEVPDLARYSTEKAKS